MIAEIDINEGALTEDFVAAEFAKKGYPLFYYDKKSKYELDFLLQDKDGVHIVEVKSGDNYKSHASLSYALESEPSRISQATVLCKGNLLCENGIRYLPLYMAMFI